MELEDKLRIEDEEVAQIREECVTMLTVKKDTIHEITQYVIHNEDVKISVEDVKNVLTSIRELKRKKLEFLVSKY